jgi:hypothetical protein
MPLFWLSTDSELRFSVVGWVRRDGFLVGKPSCVTLMTWTRGDDFPDGEASRVGVTA